MTCFQNTSSQFIVVYNFEPVLSSDELERLKTDIVLVGLV